MNFEKSHIAWLFFAFGLALLAYSFGKKQSLDAVTINHETDYKNNIKPKFDVVEPNSRQKPFASESNALSVEKSQRLETPLKNDPVEVAIKNLPHKEKISKFIKEAKPEEIDFYLNQYFGDDILAEVSDKRSFSKRLLQEYSTIDSIQTQIPHGSIFFSLTDKFPEQVSNSFSVDYKQAIYAHLRFDGSIANKGDVFVRWVRLADNKIMLFERKKINSLMLDNWVSLKPNSDWHIGTYLVTFYSFNSELSILAQDTYNIDSIGN